MRHLMIEYANSAGDRWAAWVVAASLDSAALLAAVGLVWLIVHASRPRANPPQGNARPG